MAFKESEHSTANSDSDERPARILVKSIGRAMAAVQLALAFIAPSLMPFIGTNAVLVVLAVSNAFGGIAGLYGWKQTSERS
jgi:hypothetical protein